MPGVCRDSEVLVWESLEPRAVGKGSMAVHPLFKCCDKTSLETGERRGSAELGQDDEAEPTAIPIFIV